VRWPFRHLSKIDQIPSIAPFISWLSTPLNPLQRMTQKLLKQYYFLLNNVRYILLPFN
jgi:hypothetical protein